MAVKHFSYMIETNGTTFTNTLCQKHVYSGDLNVADTDEDVTCKLCLKAMNNPNNWRWVRYQKYGIK